MHRPEDEISQRHPEEQERGSCRGQDQVLERRFDAVPFETGIGNEGVERDAQGLETEEKRDKMIADDEHDRPQRGKQDEQVILFLVAGDLFKEAE